MTGLAAVARLVAVATLAAVAALLAAAGAISAETAAPSPEPAVPRPAAPPDSAAAVEAERRAKDASFRDDPWSPLRAFARYDFPEGAGGAAVVGSGGAADVRLRGDGVAERQAMVTVLAPETPGGPHRFRLESLAPGGGVRADGQPLGDPGEQSAVRTVPEETHVEIGPFAMRPYVQGGAGILIVFDSRRTTVDRFEPPRYFPYDPAWRFRAPLVRFEDPEPIKVETSLGRSKEYRRAGYFELEKEGARLRVHAYQPLFAPRAGDLLSILFTDQTTGRETYGAGRYLDLDPPVDGAYTIDFNRAYNPFCNYTGAYNCPIPPRENRIGVAIRAGEMTHPHGAGDGPGGGRGDRPGGPP